MKKIIKRRISRKKPIIERFQKLAGIKPLYETETNEQIGTAIAGIVGMISAAGGMAALQMKMEDPETKKNNPKLAALLELLDELGSAASQAKAGGVREQEDEAEESSNGEISDIEDELSKIFQADCPAPESETE
tara:strand:- start:371 stop:772 length:402 start_codon:yes stop_codon:yes gene_type:complete